MGLFDMFKKKAPEPAAPAVPASITVEVATDTVCAPVTGRAIKMTDVPDPVFSGEVVGKGCAIWPDEETVYAPISGTVTVTMGHAVGITGDDGIEVLVHCGIDTVDMEGKGFTGYVKQGDKVTAGQPVLKLSKAAIAEAGHPDCVVLAVSNTAEFADVQFTKDSDANVAAGAAVLKVVRS